MPPVFMCCSVLQCVAVAVSCSRWQMIGVPISLTANPPVFVCCSVFSVLQCVAVCCSMLQMIGVPISITANPHVFVCCSMLQCAAECCSVLQCAAGKGCAMLLDYQLSCVRMR